MRLTLAAQRFAHVVPDGADPRLSARWNAERNRCYEVMTATALQLTDGVDRYAGHYRDPLLTLIQNYAYTVHGIVLSQRQRRRKTEMVVKLGPPMPSALNFPAPWKVWRVLSWIRSMDEVRRLVVQAQSEGEPGPVASSGGGQGG